MPPCAAPPPCRTLCSDLEREWGGEGVERVAVSLYECRVSILVQGSVRK